MIADPPLYPCLVYAISFISTLNTRRVVRGKGTDNQDSTTENSRGNAIFMIANPSNNRTPSHRPSATQGGAGNAATKASLGQV